MLCSIRGTHVDQRLVTLSCGNEIVRSASMIVNAISGVMCPCVVVWKSGAGRPGMWPSRRSGSREAVSPVGTVLSSGDVRPSEVVCPSGEIAGPTSSSVRGPSSVQWRSSVNAVRPYVRCRSSVQCICPSGVGRPSGDVRPSVGVRPSVDVHPLPMNRCLSSVVVHPMSPIRCRHRVTQPLSSSRCRPAVVVHL